MASFKGKYLTIIDEKRRIKLPKKLRDAMPPPPNGRLVIGPGFEDCIFLFSSDEWEKQEEQLRKLKFELPEHRFLMRIFIPESEDVKIDELGRLTIPEELLNLAQIKKEVLLRGVLSRIELWAPEVYQKYRKQYPESYEQVAERIYKAGGEGKTEEGKNHSLP
jgi:MraZ protein